MKYNTVHWMVVLTGEVRLVGLLLLVVVVLHSKTGGCVASVWSGSADRNLCT